MHGRLGHLDFMGATAAAGTMHEMFARTGAAPIACFKVPGGLVIILTDPDAIKEVMKQHETWWLAPTSADAWKSSFPNVLTGLEGGKWSLHRRVLQKVRLEALLPLPVRIAITR